LIFKSQKTVIFFSAKMFIPKKLYKYRLKEARWGELSRSLKEAVNYTCDRCNQFFQNGNYLTIHHKYYLEDRDPWDYPKSAFQVLCLRCHRSIDPSKIHKKNNDYKNEMSKKKFIVTNKWENYFYETSNLPFNKFFSIVYYGEIIDCGYTTRFDGGDGRFDFELIIRELNNKDNSYSRFRLNKPKERGFRSCLKIEDYLDD
jgi:hypothetical protein